MVERIELIEIFYGDGTLLNAKTAEDVQKNAKIGKQRKNILACGESWWLRSPGKGTKDRTMFIDADGNIVDAGECVDKELGIRPVLIYSPYSDHLNIGDKLHIFERYWTVVSDTHILCNDIVGYEAFRNDGSSNDYRWSDIRKWLCKWTREQWRTKKFV